MKETDSWKTFERTGAIKDYLQYKSSTDTTESTQLQYRSSVSGTASARLQDKCSVREAADLKKKGPDNEGTI